MGQANGAHTHSNQMGQGNGQAMGQGNGAHTHGDGAHSHGQDQSSNGFDFGAAAGVNTEVC